MTLIVESLPGHPLSDEVILHVRKHLRRAIRHRKAIVEDLALLFGVTPEFALELGAHDVLHEGDPETSFGQRLAANVNPPATQVKLGYDAAHLKGCVQWLRARKAKEPAFERMVVTDPATLLVLSRAIDLATARTPAEDQTKALPLVLEGATGTGKDLLA
jgi:hypothetical protein